MKLELSLYASGMKNVAGAFQGKSDPFAVVTNIATTPGSKPLVIGRTEVCHNTLNPEWTTTFFIDYALGTPSSLAVSIFDMDANGREHKPMGSAVFDVAAMLGARGNTKAKKLKNNGGTLFAHVAQVQGQGVLRLRLQGVDLKNVEGWVGKSDPFFEISRQINAAGGAVWDNVYRSKSVPDSLNPTWDDATMELSTLCNGDLHRPIRIQVFDDESKSGKHVSMGAFETTVHNLVAAASCADGRGTDQRPFTLQTKNGKDVGRVQVLKALVAGHSSTSTDDVSQKMAGMSVEDKAAVTAASSNKPSFVDYISGGCELNVVVAIDFTGSNGNPKTPGTLHYLGGGKEQPNDYQKAIRAILNVLSQYDNDALYPVLGFGAKYDGVVQHCFQCGPTPEAHGVQGVLDAYAAVFHSGLIMSSPTVFTEVIEKAAGRAERAQEAAASRKNGGQAYTILLIVTDGAVSDPQATASVLQNVAAAAPMSVVIVGVGNADFSSMKFLDDHASKSDNSTSSSSRRRDVAQFVEFNKHCANSVDLTSATLKEIPDQLVGYFTSKNIAPLPAVKVKAGEIIVEDEDEEEEIDLRFGIGEEEEEDIVVTGGGVHFVNGFAAA
jgi:Copine/C2 domain